MNATPTPPAGPTRPRADLVRPVRDGLADQVGASDALAGAGARVGVELSLAAGRPVSATLRQVGTGPAAVTETGVWFALTGPTGPGALLLERAVAVALADVLQGGRGAGADRLPSEIELHVLGTHLRRAVRPLGAALEPLGVGALAVGAVGRGAATAAVGGQQALRLELAVTVGQDEHAVTGTVTVLVPAPARTPDPTQPAAPAAAAVLEQVPFTLEIVLASTRLPAARVADLAVGDLLRTGHRLHEPVTGVVAHQPLFLADLGQHGGQHTVAITTLIKESTR